MAGLLPKVGQAAGFMGGMAGINALGLGNVLAPLDYPRQSLWNSRAMPASGGFGMANPAGGFMDPLTLLEQMGYPLDMTRQLRRS